MELNLTGLIIIFLVDLGSLMCFCVHDGLIHSMGNMLRLLHIPRVVCRRTKRLLYSLPIFALPAELLKQPLSRVFLCRKDLLKSCSLMLCSANFAG